MTGINIYQNQNNYHKVNILFILAFENEAKRTSYPGYYFPNVELKDYNVMMKKISLINQ